MMYSATCPKCGGTKIVRVNGTRESYGDGNNMRIGLMTFVMIHRYICCNCGFTEEWIDPKDLARVESSSKAMLVGHLPPQYPY